MSVPYTFGTNTYAQSGQLDANFAALNNGLSNIDASQITTGTLPVARGGTGAGTAPAALTSLGAVAKAGDTMTGGLAGPAFEATGASAVLQFNDRVTGTEIWNLYSTGGLARLQRSDIGADCLSLNGAGGLTLMGSSNAYGLQDRGGSTTINWITFSSGGLEHWQRVDFGTDAMTLDPSGNFTIFGAAVKPGGGTWNPPSDPRLKRDVEPYSTGLDAICSSALSPISFAYNGKGGIPDDGRRHVGLDASIVGEVMPELVGKMRLGEEEYLTLDPNALLYALINAVKTLAAKIEALEKR